MEKLEQKIRQTIKEHHMLQQGDLVIIALSGGADSVCLLSVLADMREEFALKLMTLHVHHGLRGEEADRDAEFSKKISKAYHVPCHMIKADVKQYASRNSLSEEEAGRLIRYQALEEAGKNWEKEAKRPVKIAVAHHSRDQAETILLNLFRGSGLGGLKGIPYVRENIIRPLLDVEKEEILAYLEEKKLSWVNDSSNDTDHYARNRIRGHILPAIKEEITTGAEAGIRRAGYLAGMADTYLKKQAEKWIQEQVTLSDDHCVIPEKPFKQADPVIRLYSIMELLKQYAGSAKDLSLIHAEQTEKLFEKQTGRRIFLPYHLQAEKVYGGVKIRMCSAKKENEAADANEKKSLKTPLPEPEFEVFSYEKAMEFPQKIYTKWFDCDKIKGTPIIRTRQTGDYITLSGGGKKALRRFMIDEKIPANERDKIALLADGAHVMWVIGWRISNYYKIGPDTKRVLQVRIKKEDQ